jgi:hypothetical protein
MLFCATISCTMISWYKRFEGTYCLHLQSIYFFRLWQYISLPARLYGVIKKKTKALTSLLYGPSCHKLPLKGCYNSLLGWGWGVKRYPCGQHSCVHSSCHGIQMNEYGELVVEYINWKENRKTVGQKCRDSSLFTTNPRWAAPPLNIRLSYGAAYWSTNQVKARGRNVQIAVASLVAGESWV